MKVVIIGGVTGGAYAAAILRRIHEHAQILLVERGEYVSFASCGLPYYVGGHIKERKHLTLQTPESFLTRFAIDVRLATEATRVIPERQCVVLYDHKKKTSYEAEYDKLILAPDSVPSTSQIEGHLLPGVFGLKNIPDALLIRAYVEEFAPKAVTIIGADYISMEMAVNLHSSGIRVNIVDTRKQILSPLDADVAASVQQYARAKGIDITLNSTISSIEKDGETLTVHLSDGSIESDLVLISMSVLPSTAYLKDSSVALTDGGMVVVDSDMQTNIPNIYAIGDAVLMPSFTADSSSLLSLTSPINQQGRVVADHIANRSAATNKAGTSILKLFDLAVFITGMSEKMAIAANIEYDKTYLYAASHVGYYPGSTSMLIKALWEKESGRIIGAQIVGHDGVDKRSDVIASAIRNGCVISDLAEWELNYAPPFSSTRDPVNMLGYIGENIRNASVKQFFWHEVEDLQSRDDVLLIDVRTRVEVAGGSIPGFINIPVDELRRNIHALPKDKHIYLHCYSDQRSYIACRVLSSRGFDCYNLAGGWRLYSSVMNELSLPPEDCIEQVTQNTQQPH